MESDIVVAVDRDDDYDSLFARAAEKGKLQVVRNLLKMGANINATYHSNTTAFMLACEHDTTGWM